MGCLIFEQGDKMVPSSMEPHGPLHFDGGLRGRDVPASHHMPPQRQRRCVER